MKRRRRNIFDQSAPSMIASALSISGGLGGGLALNYNTNVHKYHKYNKQKTVKCNGGSQSFDESKRKTAKNVKIISNVEDCGDSIGGMSTFKHMIASSGGRQRASSSESVSLTPSFTSKPIPFSKDDDYKLNDKYKYYARRSRGNNSPKMIPHLFSLPAMNEFVSPNGAISVVTNSFTAIHDDQFKFVENHF